MDDNIHKKQAIELVNKIKRHYQIAKEYQSIPKFMVIFGLAWLIGVLLHTRISYILVMLLFYDLGCLAISVYHQLTMQKLIQELTKFNKYHHLK